MNKKIGFIGVGNMATAIIGGMLNNAFAKPDDVNIFDLNADKCKAFAGQGCVVCDSLLATAEHSDIVVLAVKPQNYPDVLSKLSTVDCNDKIFVSIAAGISIAYIRTLLQQNVKAVRVMPNTPLLLSKGATALCPSDNISQDEFGLVCDMFALGGVVEVIDEQHMNEIISINGSSPAYIYLFAKAMTEYADECGIDRQKALNLVCATLEGAATMMQDSGDDLDTLIQNVSSPGGTTIAALNTLQENNFVDVIKSAMKACTDRAEELGR